MANWLSECCEKLDDRFISGFRVQTFDTPSGSLAARQPHQVDFENGIVFTGYRAVNLPSQPGELLHLTLYWTAQQPITTSCTVFVHLLTADGFNVANADSPPANGKRPTDQWAIGETIIDSHPILLPADLPPSQYSDRSRALRLAFG